MVDLIDMKYHEHTYSSESLKLICKICIGWILVMLFMGFLVHPFLKNSYFGLGIYLLVNYLFLVIAVMQLSKKSEDDGTPV